MPDASRPWRMIHRSITTSERLGAVSDSAWRLHQLLLISQDDFGCFPWIHAMVRSLIAGASWTPTQANEFLRELVTVQAVSNTDSLLTIWRGEELNGAPKSGDELWQKPRRYVTQGNKYEKLIENLLSPPEKPSRVRPLT